MRFNKLLSGMTWVGAALLMVTLSSASSVSARGFHVTGVWYTTVFFGDPTIPETLTVSCTITFHVDRTLLLDCSSATGQHPILPGHKTAAHGVWKRKGNSIEARGIFFDDMGAGLGFSVGRTVAEVSFDSHHQLSGFADVDFLPCPGGATGCPDPTEGDFLELGDGLGAIPVVMKRFR